MLLISRFRTLILLVCIAVPPPGLTQKCWHPSETADADGDDPYGEEESISTPGNLCAIEPVLGSGIGDKPITECPPGNYTKGKILCGFETQYNHPMCCCENDPPTQTPACSNLYKLESTSKQLCANDPIFKNSSWCKPPNVCENAEGEVETCPERARLIPYCKMDPHTGQPQGCSLSPGLDCPFTGSLPSDLKYVGSEMLCQTIKTEGQDYQAGETERRCCCVGSPTEPCNGLTKLCQVDLYKNMTACQPTTTTSSKPPSNPNPTLHKNGVAFNPPDSFVGGPLLLTGLLAAVYLRY